MHVRYMLRFYAAEVAGHGHIALTHNITQKEVKSEPTASHLCIRLMLVQARPGRRAVVGPKGRSECE
jgi:hypothetical protein